MGSGRAGWAGREKGEREWAAGSVGLDWAWGFGFAAGLKADFFFGFFLSNFYFSPF